MFYVLVDIFFFDKIASSINIIWLLKSLYFSIISLINISQNCNIGASLTTIAQNDIEHTQKPTQSNKWTEKCKFTDNNHCFNAYYKSPKGDYLYLIAKN